MSTTKYVVVYNTSSTPVRLDDETGTQVLPQEFAAAQRSKVHDRIEDGSLVLIGYDITEQSSPNARRAKAECDRLTKEWEAEKAETAAKTEPADAPVYDDSEGTASSTKRSPKR